MYALLSPSWERQYPCPDHKELGTPLLSSFPLWLLVLECRSHTADADAGGVLTIHYAAVGLTGISQLH